MKLVVIESPYAGDVAGNLAYAKRCVHDCLKRGEAPYASHLFFTQDGILDDLVPAERKLGIEAGFAWAGAAASRVFYVDRGWSKGMRQGYVDAIRKDQCIEIRALDRETNGQDVVDAYESTRLAGTEKETG
jgi:hypothetical protein